LNAIYKFIVLLFQATPPDTSKIPLQDAVGVTVVLLTCSYRNKEFIRVGYYVNNEYDEPEMKEVPPTVPQYDKVGIKLIITAAVNSCSCLSLKKGYMTESILLTNHFCDDIRIFIVDYFHHFYAGIRFYNVCFDYFYAKIIYM
jgi:hypothetical protein